MVSKAKYLYNKGHKCHICGKKVDSYDSFSMKFKEGKEIVTCNVCDKEQLEEQRAEDHRINREQILRNGDHEQGGDQ